MRPSTQIPSRNQESAALLDIETQRERQQQAVKRMIERDRAHALFSKNWNAGKLIVCTFATFIVLAVILILTFAL